MTSANGGWTRCLDFVNTANEDLNENNWFDTCVSYTMAAWSGSELLVKLRNENNAVVYSATGTRQNTWTLNTLTSAAAAGSQYNVANHLNLVALSNGDRLMVTGKSALGSGCVESMGNGYGLVIYPGAPPV